MCSRQPPTATEELCALTIEKPVRMSESKQSKFFMSTICTRNGEIGVLFDFGAVQNY
jgi:hypothetical protein